MENTIERFSRYLQQELGINDDRREAVAYGLHFFFSTVFGFAAIAIVGWALGVFSLAMTAAITTSFLRVVSGGAHSRRLRNCVLLGAIVSPGIGLVSKFSYQSIGLTFLYVLVIAIWLYGLRNIYKYAPADTPNKPITSETARRRYRRLSFALMSVWLTLVGGNLVTGGDMLPGDMILASALGLLWQVFSLSPQGYKTLEGIDQLLP